MTSARISVGVNPGLIDIPQLPTLVDELTHNQPDKEGGVALARPPRKELGRYGPLVGVAAWVIAVIIVGKIATDDNVRTLYPVGTDGTIETAGNHVAAPLGIAVYVAGFGLALALAGILMRVTAIQSRETEDLLAAWDAEDEAEAEKEKADTEKQCPDCAETILRAAKVCKHRGYRF